MTLLAGQAQGKVQIQRVAGFNPFDEFPCLVDIWPVISSCMAQSATREALEHGETGVCLITLKGLPIGMSGYFLNEDPGAELGLRWHGILAAYRKKGYSLSALVQVLRLAHDEFPDATYIAEYVPMTAYKNVIIAYFTSLGFEPFGAVFEEDWSAYPMQGYRVNIASFLQAHQMHP